MIEPGTNKKTCFYLLLSSFIIAIVFLVPLTSFAVELSTLPQSQVVYQGDTFILEVRIDTEGEEINAIEGHLEFPWDKLEVVALSKGGSVLYLWPEEASFFNQTGEISFAGGIPGGFQGQGRLLSIIFRVIPRVDPRLSASINFQDNSRVLLNDGKGTSASLSFKRGEYEIVEKPKELSIISSRTHPDQNKWYQSNTLHLHWDLVEGTEYSYLLSRDPLADPDEIQDKPEGELIWMGDIEYRPLEDGIYYFSLRESRGTDAEFTPTPNFGVGGKWGPKVTFRAMIDSTPPEDFQPKIAEIEWKNYVVFTTVDKTSGVDHYEVAELRGTQRGTTRKEEWKVGRSPYLLEEQGLRSIIKVKAVDKAGNERIAEIVPPPPKVIWKDILPWMILGLLGLIVAGVIYWIITKHYTKQKRNNKY